jgi:hypothetical protein
VTRPDPRPEDVQNVVEELGRISFAEHSLQSLVQRVTDMAARVVLGEPVTSVTIVTDGRPRTVAASGPLAVDLDDTQYRLGDGPCVSAATTGLVAEVPDTSADRRWPQFGRAAADRGCTRVVSVPLPVQELVSGGLNVYLCGARPEDESAAALATRFAGYAVVPVSNMYLYTSALERADHLAAALDSRGVIDQAKGIMMERFKLTADQAFQALARVSMESNLKVREIAERFVRTGELRPR